VGAFVAGSKVGGRREGPAIPASRFRAAEHGWAPVVAGAGGGWFTEGPAESWVHGLAPSRSKISTTAQWPRPLTT
jgi:hypothetical protein